MHHTHADTFFFIFQKEAPELKDKHMYVHESMKLMSACTDNQFQTYTAAPTISIPAGRAQPSIPNTAQPYCPYPHPCH
jgi:hypothetical protein